MARRTRIGRSLARALQRMIDPSATHEWSPGYAGPMPTLTRSAASDGRPRPQAGVSTADLNERQREVAFTMYGAALLRLTQEDARRHTRKRRESA